MTGAGRYRKTAGTPAGRCGDEAGSRCAHSKGRNLCVVVVVVCGGGGGEGGEERTSSRGGRHLFWGRRKQFTDPRRQGATASPLSDPAQPIQHSGGSTTVASMEMRRRPFQAQA